MKVFNAIKFFEDNGIDYRTKGSAKCTAGWVNIKCPLCQGSDFYLGFHLESGAWKCWRCGTHGLHQVLKAILGDSSPFIRQTIERYTVGFITPTATVLEVKKRSQVKLPQGIVSEIPKKAKEYLLSRKFDPELLTKTWHLDYTGPLGDYKFRIIAPIYHEGKLVSYQGRDYTGKSLLRYKACRKEDEVMDHQHCLYGSWLVKGDSAVVVEGIADAWRMGPGAVATFGLAWTDNQFLLLSRYKRLFFLFDGEPQAIEEAYKLADIIKINNRNIEIHIVELEGGDPGEMDQDDANHLMKELGL